MDVFPIGSQTVLCCGRTERLSELNETAALIWRDAAEGRSFAQICGHLEEAGASAREAETFVSLQVNEWLRCGYLIPEDALALTRKAPIARRRVSIDELDAELLVFGAADASTLDAFANVSKETGEIGDPLRLCVIGEGDVDYILLNDLPLGMTPRRGTLPKVKHRLTRELFQCAESGFFTHGALVSRDGVGVFMAGEPGAGKTTLTMALVAHGFAYGGDDTVRIDMNGNAKGLPLAAAVKTGAWTLLADAFPELETLQTHERRDGLFARYVAPRQIDDTFRPIDVFLKLDRTDGAQAHCEPLTPLEALSTMIKGGYVERPMARSLEVMRALSAQLSAASCHRFVYDDLSAAVSLIEDLVAARAG